MQLSILVGIILINSWVCVLATSDAYYMSGLESLLVRGYQPHRTLRRESIPSPYVMNMHSTVEELRILNPGKGEG